MALVRTLTSGIVCQAEEGCVYVWEEYRTIDTSSFDLLDQCVYGYDKRISTDGELANFVAICLGGNL